MNKTLNNSIKTTVAKHETKPAHKQRDFDAEARRARRDAKRKVVL